MITLTERTIMKSRSGVYSDTSENRRKHRVGQKYGADKQPEDDEKNEKKEADLEKELEAINKVIAAVNEGKLKLPPEEINTLVAKKTMAEEAVKQAKGEKKPEKKEEPKKEAAKPEAKSEGKQYAQMDIKEAKKELVGKKITFKEYFFDGVDSYKDAEGEIKKVRLYGKEKQPIVEIDFPNGDGITISLEQLDKRKAMKYEIEFNDSKSEEPKQEASGQASEADKEDRQKIKEEMKEKYDVSSVVKEVKEKLKGLSVESSLELLNKELPNRIQDIYGTYDKELSKFDDVKIKNSIHTVSNSKFESLHAALSKEYDKITEKAISEGIIPDGWKFKPDGRITKKVSVPESEGGGKFSLTVDTKRGNELYVSMTNRISNDKIEEIRSIEQKFSSKEEALSFVEKFLGNEPKEKVDTDSEEGGEETEVYTRVKFEDVPNSGKVNLKKYLSDKVRNQADENLGVLSKVSFENLQTMEKGLVKEFNSQFGSLSKSRRAEKLYSIMKVKSELENRKQEESKKYQKYTSSLDDNTLLSIGYDLGEEIRKLSSRGFSTLEQQQEVLKKISELSGKRQINEDEQRKRMDKLNNSPDETRANKKGELAKRGNESQKKE